MIQASKLSAPPPPQGSIALSEIIALHKKHSSPLALTGNIGDPYLLATNTIYRNIREDFLRRGYRFELNGNHKYFVFPLMSLDHLMETRVVPYRDNFQWLEILEEKTPGRFGLEAVRRFDLRKNYLLHEAAHCIAHEELMGLGGPEKDTASLLIISAGESFANTVECLSSLFLEGEISNYFLAQNIYHVQPFTEVAAILTMARSAGFSATAHLLFYSYLYANFLHTSLGSKEKELLLRFCRLKDLPEGGEQAIKAGLNLSELFRMNTSVLYLMQQGFSDQIIEKRNEDPLELMLALPDGGEKLRQRVSSLIEIAIRGLEKDFSF